MFNFFKGKKGIVIGAPIEGEVVPITEVSDPTFGEKVLGDGIAVKPAVGKVVSPVDGTVAMMFDTGHAVNIVSDDGTEILIHVGLDTVALKGEHFKVHAQNNQKVQKGDLLIEFDIEAIKAAGYDVISPLVILNTPEYKEIKTFTGPAKTLDKVLELIKK